MHAVRAEGEQWLVALRSKTITQRIIETELRESDFQSSIDAKNDSCYRDRNVFFITHLVVKVNERWWWWRVWRLIWDCCVIKPASSYWDLCVKGA